MCEMRLTWLGLTRLTSVEEGLHSFSSLCLLIYQSFTSYSRHNDPFHVSGFVRSGQTELLFCVPTCSNTRNSKI